MAKYWWGSKLLLSKSSCFITFCFDTSLLRSEGPPISKNFQQIHPVIQDDNWSQLWLPFNNLNIWIVTLETSIIRIITFSRIELYLPNSKDSILCQWHDYISNFKLLAPTQLLPPQLQLTEIWEMLAISNYANPQLVISTPLLFIPTPCN